MRTQTLPILLLLILSISSCSNFNHSRGPASLPKTPTKSCLNLLHDIVFIKENSSKTKERRDELITNYYKLFDRLISERERHGITSTYKKILRDVILEEESVYNIEEILFEMKGGYRTTRLLDVYFNEIEHDHFNYLSLEEVEKFKVNIHRAGFFLNNKGHPIGVNLKTYARYDYVLTQDGEIFLRDSSHERKGIKGEMRMNHSSFFRGLPIAAAGEFAIKDAQLLAISGLSGHYLPDDEFFQQIKVELKKRNVDLTYVKELWTIPDPEN